MYWRQKTFIARWNVPIVFFNPIGIRIQWINPWCFRTNGFLSISFRNFDLPAAAISVECQDFRRVSQRVDELVHTENGMQITHCYCVALSVVDSEMVGSVLSWGEDNRRCLLGLRLLEDFQLEHLEDFILLKLPPFEFISKWPGVD